MSKENNRSKHTRFEEDVIIPSVKTFFEKEINEKGEREFLHVDTEYRISCKKFPPPARDSRIDVLASNHSYSMVVESKIVNTPYSISTAIGQVLVQRSLLIRKEPLKGPIRLCICFPNFSEAYEKDDKSYRKMIWNDECAQLLADTSNLINEPIGLLLFRTDKIKPRRQLLQSDIEFDWRIKPESWNLVK